MNLRAQIYHYAPDDARGAPRAAAGLSATLRAQDGAPLDVHIQDLSATGFAMASSGALRLHQNIWIGLTGAGVNAARVVRRTSDGWACEFLQPISVDQFRAALTAQSTVTTAPWTGQGTNDQQEPAVKRWPFAARIAFIVGSSLALWSAIYWVIA